MQRDQAWEATRSSPIQVTPTRLQQAGRPVPAQAPRASAGAERSLLIGTLAHRVLQHWEFSRQPGELRGLITRVCDAGLPVEWVDKAGEVQHELEELLLLFTKSAPYRELQRATILGREVPFAMSWEGNRPWAMGYGPGQAQADSSLSPIAHRPLPASCVLEGVIDVVYRLDGKIRLADYKTDRVEDSEIAARASEYGVQARIYREAAARCLGIKDVGCEIIFVRSGTSVSV
jgi:ATP-dependent exoDNAse (exonuclease V) beta subunit